MLKGLFSKKTLPFNGPQPLVVVDIGADDPNRGDTHGFIGIARRIAEKLDGRMVCLDREELESTYLEPLQKGYPQMSHDARLTQHFKRHGYPDIFFSRFSYLSSEMIKNGTGLVVSCINERLSQRIDQSSALVAHHLSPDVLTYEGYKFSQEYSELPRPYIAVMIADSVQMDIAKRLTEICKNHDEVTIFVCGSRRTDSKELSNFSKKLRFGRAEAGLVDRLHIVEYDFRQNEENYGYKQHYNMYVGLLDQADHIIVGGYSGSMVSESLATGKVPFATKDFFFYSSLVQKGLVDYFLNCSSDKPLLTRHIKPVNITEDLADNLIAQYKANKGFGGAFQRLRIKMTQAVGRPAHVDFEI